MSTSFKIHLLRGTAVDTVRTDRRGNIYRAAIAYAFHSSLRAPTSSLLPDNAHFTSLLESLKVAVDMERAKTQPPKSVIGERVKTRHEARSRNERAVIP